MSYPRPTWQQRWHVSVLAHGTDTALGWLVGIRRVRADLDPRLLSWTALVSADDLSGF